MTTPNRFRFRAWDKKNSIMSDSFDFSRMIHEYSVTGFFDDKSYPDYDDVIFMQSTGLLDSNGKEIIEGDIVKKIARDNSYEVKFGSYEQGDHYEIGENYVGGYGFYMEDVKYKDVISFDLLDNLEVEIIGNIYQNTNLPTNAN